MHTCPVHTVLITAKGQHYSVNYEQSAYDAHQYNNRAMGRVLVDKFAMKRTQEQDLFDNLESPLCKKRRLSTPDDQDVVLSVQQSCYHPHDTITTMSRKNGNYNNNNNQQQLLSPPPASTMHRNTAVTRNDFVVIHHHLETLFGKEPFMESCFRYVLKAIMSKDGYESYKQSFLIPCEPLSNSAVSDCKTGSWCRLRNLDHQDTPSCPIGTTDAIPVSVNSPKAPSVCTILASPCRYDIYHILLYRFIFYHVAQLWSCGYLWTNVHTYATHAASLIQTCEKWALDQDTFSPNQSRLVLFLCANVHSMMTLIHFFAQRDVQCIHSAQHALILFDVLLAMEATQDDDDDYVDDVEEEDDDVEDYIDEEDNDEYAEEDDDEHLNVGNIIIHEKHDKKKTIRKIKDSVTTTTMDQANACHGLVICDEYLLDCDLYVRSIDNEQHDELFRDLPCIHIRRAMCQVALIHAQSRLRQCLDKEMCNLMDSTLEELEQQQHPYMNLPSYSWMIFIKAVYASLCVSFCDSDRGAQLFRQCEHALHAASYETQQQSYSTTLGIPSILVSRQSSRHVSLDSKTDDNCAYIQDMASPLGCNQDKVPCCNDTLHDAVFLMRLITREHEHGSKSSICCSWENHHKWIICQYDTGEQYDRDSMLPFFAQWRILHESNHCNNHHGGMSDNQFNVCDALLKQATQLLGESHILILFLMCHIMIARQNQTEKIRTYADRAEQLLYHYHVPSLQNKDKINNNSVLHSSHMRTQCLEKMILFFLHHEKHPGYDERALSLLNLLVDDVQHQLTSSLIHVNDPSIVRLLHWAIQKQIYLCDKLKRYEETIQCELRHLDYCSDEACRSSSKTRLCKCYILTRQWDKLHQMYTSHQSRLSQIYKMIIYGRGSTEHVILWIKYLLTHVHILQMSKRTRILYNYLFHCLRRLRYYDVFVSIAMHIIDSWTGHCKKHDSLFTISLRINPSATTTSGLLIDQPQLKALDIHPFPTEMMHQIGEAVLCSPHIPTISVQQMDQFVKNTFVSIDECVYLDSLHHIGYLLIKNNEFVKCHRLMMQHLPLMKIPYQNYRIEWLSSLPVDSPIVNKFKSMYCCVILLIIAHASKHYPYDANIDPHVQWLHRQPPIPHASSQKHDLTKHVTIAAWACESYALLCANRGHDCICALEYTVFSGNLWHRCGLRKSDATLEHHPSPAIHVDKWYDDTPQNSSKDTQTTNNHRNLIHADQLSLAQLSDCNHIQHVFDYVAKHTLYGDYRLVVSDRLGNMTKKQSHFLLDILCRYYVARRRFPVLLFEHCTKRLITDVMFINA